jgi:hypothetical protein
MNSQHVIVVAVPSPRGYVRHQVCSLASRRPATKCPCVGACVQSEGNLRPRVLRHESKDVVSNLIILLCSIARHQGQLPKPCAPLSCHRWGMVVARQARLGSLSRGVIFWSCATFDLTCVDVLRTTPDQYLALKCGDAFLPRIPPSNQRVARSYRLRRSISRHHHQKNYDGETAIFTMNPMGLDLRNALLYGVYEEPLPFRRSPSCVTTFRVSNHILQQRHSGT